MGLSAIFWQPLWLNFELTNQGRMIGKFNLGDLKIVDFYLRAVKYVI